MWRRRKSSVYETHRPREVLNKNEDDWMYADPYATVLFKKILCWILIVASVGILAVVLLIWRRDWYVKLTCRRTTVEHANVFILQDACEELTVSYVYNMANREKYYRKPPQGSILSNAPLIAPINGRKGEFEEVKVLTYFDCKRVRYIWNTDTNAYEKLLGIPDVPMDYFDEQKGLDDIQRSERLRLFGLNAIVIKIDPLVKILIKEGLTPFYAFQVFSIILWYCEPYTVYASVILGISLLSLASQVFETRRQQVALHKRVQDFDLVTIMKKNGETASVKSETLVPGDIVIIPKTGCKVVCDAVLLSGHCIVNEASLTGESIPVSKVALASSDKEQYFKARSSTRHILFCGTKVLQSRAGTDGYTKACVIRTGFMTSKGELIRSIMYFRQVDFQFQNQTFWYIAVLGFIALIGMIYSIIVELPRLYTAVTPEEITAARREIAIRTLDVITIVVPPALPAALTVGIIFSQWRLKKKQIFCISPRIINMCGLVNLVCFDKTGTLTEDGLDLHSILPAEATETGRSRFIEKQATQFTDIDKPLVRSMTACHSLSIIDKDDSLDYHGDPIVGDPLDLIMFNHTHWKLSESEVAGFGKILYRVVSPTIATIGRKFQEQAMIVLYKEYPFESTMRRMGMIGYNTAERRFEFYAKGAAEKIIPLCNPDTVPADALSRLEGFSSQGFRVIALAWRVLDGMDINNVGKLTRGVAEHDLRFVGFIVFENRIKSDTPSTISELEKANIRTVMLTGDNMHTAIAVAGKCGIVRASETLSIVQGDEKFINYIPVEQVTSDKNGSHKEAKHSDMDPFGGSGEHQVLAVSGEMLEIVKTYHSHLLPQIMLRTAVFARVSPLEKQYVVEQFQGAGYQVGMCGDGANDCGALRAAHAGISLSDSEAAAAAPFTSTNPSIHCVVRVLREGRCALVTFFGIFFLMATYSMCQFISVVLLYWIEQTLTDMEFLYEDLFELTVLAIVIGCALPYNRLTADSVPSSLKSFPSLFSLIGHVLLLLAAQIVAFKVAPLVPCNPNGTTIVCPQVKADAASDATTTPAPVLNLTALAVNLTSGNSTDNATAPAEVGCSYEGYAVWTVGILQIVVLSFIFARGPPFRRPFWRNYLHVILAVGMVVFDLVCMLGPDRNLAYGIQMDAPPPEYIGYRFIFLAIVIIWAILAAAFEMLIVERLVVRWLDRSTRFKKWRSRRRADVEEELRLKADRAEYRPKDGPANGVTFQNKAFVPDESSTANLTRLDR
ncbi:polyamine-transporting ATPase 13A3-like [Paramacrobiotus metropolitanus]|uniref:polyamine-transporting ATPase 13A3-like n=1 Tax=Paramacrobiotus metropolitanus TaxID=2943436 RepID=UPI0024465A2B|nr:polyamine-transporting ATPase 13A3-like [Paramacrobiotus metropolitanus]